MLDCSVTGARAEGGGGTTTSVTSLQFPCKTVVYININTGWSERFGGDYVEQSRRLVCRIRILYFTLEVSEANTEYKI